MRLIGRTIYLSLVTIWVFAAVCISAQAAYAYVDPGNGLFCLQVIGSTFLGFTFLARKRLRQLLGRFGGNKNQRR